MRPYRYIVLLNGNLVIRYSSIRSAYARKRKIENLWWFNKEEDEIEIYDTIKGTFL